MPNPAALSTTPASTANSRIRSARLNRRPHPNLAALKERAFALTCTGLRSPAIALQLGVPERTIRRWVNDTLLTLAQNALDPDCDSDSAMSAASNDPNDPSNSDHIGAAKLASTNGTDPTSGDTTSADHSAKLDTRATPISLERHRALAIESQRAVAATAHAAYDRLMARHDDLLDALTTVLRDNLLSATDGAGAATVSLPALPPSAALLTRLLAQLEAGATRHLRIAQAAHREAARFQGVPAYAQTAARLIATAAHSAATADPDEDDEPGDGFIPIEWIDPNAPTKEGLIPRHTFDGNAALDLLCNGPRSSLDRLRQADGANDDDDDEQDEATTLAAIIAEQIASDSPATNATTPPATSAATNAATDAATGASLATNPAARPLPSEGRGQGVRSLASATTPVTGTATNAATGAATTPATGASLATNPAARPLPSEGRGQGVRSDSPHEEGGTVVQSLSSTRHPPLNSPGPNTIAGLFLRDPHYVF